MKKRKVIVFLSWVPALVWIWAVFYFSTLPADRMPRVIASIPDYVSHGAAYFLLSFLLFVAWRITWRSNFITAFAVIVGLCLIFGLINEINQIHVLTRQFSLWDLLADVVGAVVLFLIILALQKAGNIVKRL